MLYLIVVVSLCLALQVSAEVQYRSGLRTLRKQRFRCSAELYPDDPLAPRAEPLLFELHRFFTTRTGRFSGCPYVVVRFVMPFLMASELLTSRH